MLLEIIEPDEKYTKDFTRYLIDKFGGREIKARVIEISDAFKFENFHGLRIFTGKSFLDDFLEAGKWLNAYAGNFEFYVNLKKQYHTKGTLSPKQIESVQKAIARDIPKVSWFEENKDVVEWLKNYTGNFEFYVSLQTQFRQRACLSPKQVESVRKAIARDKDRANPPVQTQQTFTLKPGDIIRVSKWFGKQTAEAAGLVRPHFVMEVVSVLAESEKAYRAVLKISAQRTSHCCICGLKLTNKKSVLAGIGPICGGSYSISFGENSLRELEERFLTTKEVTTWFPKAAIKERYSK